MWCALVDNNWELIFRTQHADKSSLFDKMGKKDMSDRVKRKYTHSNESKEERQRCAFKVWICKNCFKFCMAMNSLFISTVIACLLFYENVSCSFYFLFCRRNVVQQVVKSLLDRIERKEELEARRRKREEREEMQKRKKENIDMVRSP